MISWSSEQRMGEIKFGVVMRDKKDNQHSKEYKVERVKQKRGYEDE